MKVSHRTPPRRFSVGPDGAITLSHCADIALEPDEQVTFTTASGTEFDVVRKDWGYYATPSLNGRLPAHGLRPALVKSGDKSYLLLVAEGAEPAFFDYLDDQRMTMICWLDGPVEQILEDTGQCR